MKAIATVLCLSLLSSCWSNDDSYSLFRSSALDGSMRVYIASFNAPDGAMMDTTKRTVRLPLNSSNPNRA